MYFLLKMVIFHCYVSLPEGRFLECSEITSFHKNSQEIWKTWMPDDTCLGNFFENVLGGFLFEVFTWEFLGSKHP